MQDFILDFDNKDLHFGLFHLFRDLNLNEELQHVRSKYLADFIKEQVIKEISVPKVPQLEN